jgi:biopolymer transport protein ExbB
MNRIHMMMANLSAVGVDSGDVVEGITEVNLLQMLRDGGWAMYPLAICSIAMLFLLFHCMRETVYSRFIPAHLLSGWIRGVQAGEVDGLKRQWKKAPTILGRALHRALWMWGQDQLSIDRGMIEASLAESFEAEENRISQWIQYLNVVAAISPMIGLLGTVSGMIGAFQVIGVEGLGKPDALAGDIGEALITTATGLVIGIPAMIGYFVLRNRLSNRMQEMVRVSSLILDCLSGVQGSEELMEDAGLLE